MLDLLKGGITADSLAPDVIRVDGGTQMRLHTDFDTVREYALAIQEGARLPAIIVYFDGKEYWLGDGFHRLDAHKLAYKDAATMPLISCEVRSGTRRDAIIHAAGANANHGLRRTSRDKQRAVDTLLRDEEWTQWSDREIARKCNVSPTFVGQRRKELTVHVDSEQNQNQERTYTTRHGTTSVMKTDNIGRQPLTNRLSLDQCIALICKQLKGYEIDQDRLARLDSLGWQNPLKYGVTDGIIPDVFRQAWGTVRNELLGRIENAERTKAKQAQFATKAPAAITTARCMELVWAALYNARFLPPLLPAQINFLKKAPMFVYKRFLAADETVDDETLWKALTKIEASLTLAMVNCVHPMIEQDVCTRCGQAALPLDQADDLVIVACPACGAEQEDLDGFGVVDCPTCGYCIHPSGTNDVCDICGNSQKASEQVSTTRETLLNGDNADRAFLARMAVSAFQLAVKEFDTYGRLIGRYTDTLPAKRALEKMTSELDHFINILEGKSDESED